jgi:hypothetical protein
LLTPRPLAKAVLHAGHDRFVLCLTAGQAEKPSDFSGQQARNKEITYFLEEAL